MKITSAPDLQPPPTTPPPLAVSTSAGNIKIERLATLEHPWGMAVLPGGRLLITEKPSLMTKAGSCRG